MKNLSSTALALVVVVLATPAFAQVHGAGPHLFPNPSLSLATPTTSPIAAQVRDDYATELMGQQRALLQQNPSGVTRDELDIGSTLNGFTPR
jgi:hypothetical protein